MVNHVALFAGMGGFIVGAKRAGIATLYANDCDRKVVETLEANFPDVAICSEDITSLTAEKIEQATQNAPIDILSAGFPCQSFSRAGVNTGFDDERGQLFYEIPRLCDALTQPPRIVFLENVAFLKHYKNGDRLQKIIHALRKCGYWVQEKQAQVLDAYHYSQGFQQRERIYIVAAHSDFYPKNYFEFPQPIENKTGSLWKIINRRRKGAEHTYLKPHQSKYTNMIQEEADKAGDALRLFQIRRYFARACRPNVCPTLTANMGAGGHNVPFLINGHGIRRLEVEECLTLQGFRPDDIIFPDSVAEGARLKMIGNAVCVDVVERIFRSIKGTFFGG